MYSSRLFVLFKIKVMVRIMFFQCVKLNENKSKLKLKLAENAMFKCIESVLMK